MRDKVGDKMRSEQSVVVVVVVTWMMGWKVWSSWMVSAEEEEKSEEGLRCW